MGRYGCSPYSYNSYNNYHDDHSSCCDNHDRKDVYDKDRTHVKDRDVVCKDKVVYFEKTKVYKDKSRVCDSDHVHARHDDHHNSYNDRHHKDRCCNDNKHYGGYGDCYPKKSYGCCPTKYYRNYRKY